jgi:hypothetical protein
MRERAMVVVPLCVVRELDGVCMCERERRRERGKRERESGWTESGHNKLPPPQRAP